MSVLFLEYPKCSTCKKAKKWLDDHGVEYVDRDITTENPTATELAEWHARSGLPLRRLFNTSGMKYRELGIKAKLDAGMTDAECFVADNAHGKFGAFDGAEARRAIAFTMPTCPISPWLSTDMMAYGKAKARVAWS